MVLVAAVDEQQLKADSVEMSDEAPDLINDENRWRSYGSYGLRPHHYASLPRRRWTRSTDDQSFEMNPSILPSTDTDQETADNYYRRYGGYYGFYYPRRSYWWGGRRHW